MMKKYLSTPILIIILVTLVAYLPLINNYFMHDEWVTFVYYYEIYSYDSRLVTNLFNFFIPQPGQYIPLTQLITYSIFHFFKLNYMAYFIIGLIFHITLGLLVYKLLLQITRIDIISLFCSLFFVVAPHHFQATSWVMANVGYSLSGIFLILGLIEYFKWLKEDRYKQLIKVSVFFLMSFLSKDITLFILPAIPIITWIYKRDYIWFIRSILIVLPGGVFAIWHIWYLKTHPISILLIENNYSLINIFTLPMRSIAQSIFPQHLIYFIAKVVLYPFPPYIEDKVHTTSFNTNVESWGAGIVVLGLCIIVSIIGLLIVKYKKEEFQNFFVGILLAGLSGIVYLFVDTRNFSLLQPRYVYISIICLSLSLSSILLISFQKWRIRTYVVSTLVLLIFVLSDITMSYRLARIGSERSDILRSVDSAILKNKNVVIYTESNKSYYGLPDNTKTFPFQTNFGKAIAVYSYEKIVFPDEMYSYFTLKNLDDQGYFHNKDGGFGYYWNLDSLKEGVIENKIDPNHVYAFYYDSNERKVINRTDAIRVILKNQIKTF